MLRWPATTKNLFRKLVSAFVALCFVCTSCLALIPPAFANPDPIHVCFPLQGEYSYSDDFGAPRSRPDGTEGLHEGVDILAPQGSVVYSMCAGQVEKKGWNDLGGNRLGIRGEDGRYYYYAHLMDYADGMEEGSLVEIGQPIGFVGNTGNGPLGTAGKFPPHLHLGIQEKGEWTNPFPLLKVIDPQSYGIGNKTAKGKDGRPEVVGKRTEFSKTFVNPDGSHTVETYAAPIHYLDESGTWQDLNLNFKEKTVVVETEEVVEENGLTEIKKGLPDDDDTDIVDTPRAPKDETEGEADSADSIEESLLTESENGASSSFPAGGDEAPGDAEESAPVLSAVEGNPINLNSIDLISTAVADQAGLKEESTLTPESIEGEGEEPEAEEKADAEHGKSPCNADEEDFGQIDIRIEEDAETASGLQEEAEQEKKEKTKIVRKKKQGYVVDEAPYELTVGENLGDPIEFSTKEGEIIFELLGCNAVAPTIDGNKAIYEGAFADTDVEHIAVPEGTKEYIILKSSSSPTSFEQRIISPFDLRKEEGGGFGYYYNGEKIAGTPSLFYVDAEESRGDIDCEIIFDGEGKRGKIYLISFSIDTKGLKFPVTIDPTITLQPPSNRGQDTYISSANPNTNYDGQPDLVSGKTTGLGVARSLVKFNLNAIPDNSTISSATFSAYGTSQNGSSNVQQTMDDCDAVGSWTTSDSLNFVPSQDTVDYQEPTGSIKLTATAVVSDTTKSVANGYELVSTAADPAPSSFTSAFSASDNTAISATDGSYVDTGAYLQHYTSGDTIYAVSPASIKWDETSWSDTHLYIVSPYWGAGGAVHMRVLGTLTPEPTVRNGLIFTGDQGSSGHNITSFAVASTGALCTWSVNSNYLVADGIALVFDTWGTGGTDPLNANNVSICLTRNGVRFSDTALVTRNFPYRFKIWIDSSWYVRAKFWPQASSEPAGWQVYGQASDPGAGTKVALGGDMLAAPPTINDCVGMSNVALTPDTSQYGKQRLAFDLTGYNLANIVQLTPSVVCYGSGGNGGATNGATVKIWNNATSSWDSVGTNTATSGSTVAAKTISSNTTSGISSYVDASNKVYLLVRSTYPSASAGFVPSKIYSDNATLTISQNSALGDTLTRDLGAGNELDLSTYRKVTFWAKSSVAGAKLQFQMGEAAASERTYDITIANANTWEQKIWDITGIPSASRDAIRYLALKCINADVSFTFNIDDIKAETGDCIYLHRITADWQEALATWNNIGSSYSSTVSALQEYVLNDWMNFDVTSLVQAYINGTYTNHGFMLLTPDETASVEKRWHSSVEATGLAPKLVVTYLPPSLAVSERTTVGDNSVTTVTWLGLEAGQKVAVCNSAGVVQATSSAVGAGGTSVAMNLLTLGVITGLGDLPYTGCFVIYGNDGTTPIQTTMVAGINGGDVYTFTPPSGPTVSITSPTAGSYNRGTVTVTGTANDANYNCDNYTLKYGAGASPSSWTSIATQEYWVTSGTLGTWDTTGITDGTYTVKLTGVSAFPLSTNTTSATVTFIVDNTAPTTEITAPAASAVVNDNPLGITGTASDANISSWELSYGVGASPSSWISLTTSSTSTIGTLYNWNNTAISDGTYTLKLDATDLAGNTSSTTTTFTLDKTNPMAELTAPANGTTVSGTNVSISGTANDVNFASYTVEYRSRASPSSWTSLASGASPVISGLFTSWNTTTLTDGTYVVRLTVVDRAGNTSVVNSAITIDNNPPTTTLTLNPATPNGSNGWYVTNPLVTLTATDTVDSSPTIYYKFNNGSYAVYSSALTVSNGKHTLHYYAVDSYGNTETAKSKSIWVDTLVPWAEITSPINGAVCKGSVTITGSATDSYLSQYVVEYAPASSPSSWTQIASSATAVSNGTLAIWDTSSLASGDYYLRLTVNDEAGHSAVFGASGELKVTVDAHTPTTTAIFNSSPTPDGENGWYVTVPTITLSAVDDCDPSPVTYYGWGEASGVYSGAFTPPIGANILKFYSKDRAGNKEATKSIEVKLDNVGPEARITDPVPEQFINGECVIKIIASDEPSGVASVVFYISGKKISTVTAKPFEVTLDTTTLEDGEHTIKAVVTDAAGNTSSHSIKVYIDNNAPVASIDDPTNLEITAGDQGTLVIKGTATDLFFDSYELYYLEQQSTASALKGLSWAVDFDAYLAQNVWVPPVGTWKLLQPAQTNVVEAGVLGSWDIRHLKPGKYWIKLVAKDKIGHISESITKISIVAKTLALTTTRTTTIKRKMDVVTILKKSLSLLLPLVLLLGLFAYLWRKKQKKKEKELARKIHG